MTKTMAVRDILAEHGTTYAKQAGISLADKPSPLYQLLVLTTLMSTRIKADIAVDAARELFEAGWRTPKAMLESTWQQRVDALGRGSYVRYDESTARHLEAGAKLLLDRYHGDLRRMREEADGDLDVLRGRLTDFPRIGEVGADIFCREVQAVWPEVRPYFDRKALAGAERAGLPTDPRKLGDLVDGDRVADLAAALIRLELD